MMRQILRQSLALMVRPKATFSELTKFRNSFLTTTNIAYI